MDTDLMLVTGIVLGVLTVPAVLAAYSESRFPRVAALMALIAATLIALAIVQKPSGYTFPEATQAFGKVFSRLTQ
jgi:hypothetical protein